MIQLAPASPTSSAMTSGSMYRWPSQSSISPAKAKRSTTVIDQASRVGGSCGEVQHPGGIVAQELGPDRVLERDTVELVEDPTQLEAPRVVAAVDDLVRPPGVRVPHD